jgi:hypothetical protein
MQKRKKVRNKWLLENSSQTVALNTLKSQNNKKGQTFTSQAYTSTCTQNINVALRKVSVL